MACLLRFGSVLLTTFCSLILAKRLALAHVDAGSQQSQLNDESSSLMGCSTPVLGPGKWPSESDDEGIIADDCSMPQGKGEGPKGERKGSEGEVVPPEGQEPEVECEETDGEEAEGEETEGEEAEGEEAEGDEAEGEETEGEEAECEKLERDLGHAMTSSHQACSPAPLFLGRNWHWEGTGEGTQIRQPFFKIAEILCKVLEDDEMRDGYIYAFQTQEQNDIGRRYIRIGANRDFDVKTGMKIRQDCYGECTLVYPSPDWCATRVKHAKRVKKLIHAELVTRGVFLKTCPTHQKCERQNLAEWFDLEAQHAVRVIQKWTQWAESSPYDTLEVAEKKQRTGSLNPSFGAGSLETSFSWTPSPSLPLPPPKGIALKIFDKNTLLELCWPLDSLPTQSKHRGSKIKVGPGVSYYQHPSKNSSRIIPVRLPPASAYKSHNLWSATRRAKYDQDWGKDLRASFDSRYTFKFPSTLSNETDGSTCLLRSQELFMVG